MKALFLACIVSTSLVSCSRAPATSSTPATSESKANAPQPGRFVLYPGLSKGEPTFLLDSAVGRLWIVSEAKDHNSFLIPVPGAALDAAQIKGANDSKQPDGAQNNQKGSQGNAGANWAEQHGFKKANP
jgi:hypothetical protein